jgi:hypothetical protein
MCCVGASLVVHSPLFQCDDIATTSIIVGGGAFGVGTYERCPYSTLIALPFLDIHM